MKRLSSILAVFIAVVLLCGVLSAPAAADTSGWAAEVVRLVNAERAKAGLPALGGGNGALHAAARQRALEISTNYNASHRRPDGRDFATILREYPVGPYTAWGENIAQGHATPAAVVSSWMSSPGHRANILSANYSHLGVGVHQSANGRICWTLLFIRSGENSPAPKTQSGLWQWIQYNLLFGWIFTRR